MNTVLFYDTETTGLPVWSTPSGDDSQPHIVQLGAILCDADTREVIERMDVIIKPDGWVIPDDVAEIHGITTEIALEKGIPEKEALEMFLKIRGDSPRVAHNRTFDQRIIRIACKRFADKEQTEKWAQKDDHECTMLASKKVMKMPGKRGFKNPKLEEAYEFFTGNALENAHSAMPDAEACMNIYFAMKSDAA